MFKPFPALPGIYRLIYLYLEPLSIAVGTFFTWTYADWFYNELIPEPGIAVGTPVALIEPRAKMVVWQLGSCGCLSREGIIHDLYERYLRLLESG